jgi:L,D-transpeptidase YcbB
MFLSRLSLLAFLFSFLLIRCHGNTDNEMEKEQVKVNLVNVSKDTIIQGISHPLSGIAFDSIQIETFLVKFPEFKEFSNDFKLFYRNRSFNYAWYDKQGLIEPAQVLLAHLQENDSLSLPMKIPYHDTLQKLFHYDDHVEDLNDNRPDLTSELMLSGQYFHYARVKWGNRLTAKAESIDWYLPRKTLSYAQLIENALSGKDYDDIGNDVLNPQYQKLRDHLKKYRELASKYPDPLPAISIVTSLHMGDSSASIPLIAERLRILGFSETSYTGTVYDRSLAPGINRYKKSLGLKSDSIITKEMVAALNLPLRKRIEQMLVNIERFRWIPPSVKSDEFILVNIPDYRLRYFEKGNETWQCNVVVGKPVTKTVIFGGEMKYIVFSPYWNVPTSIISKEVVPGMRRNSNYLASHHMEWNGGQVRQTPGPWNSLGRVKFIFPNANNIYLHDTPSKNLFNEDSRSFSHGCVRVGQPRELAIKILRNDPEWTKARIENAMNAGVEKTVLLKKKIPVYIGYFTAFVDSDGDLNFRNDVYQRDERLYSMISSDK